MAKSNEWFAVDKEGLADSIEEPARLPLELWQNAVDENVTQVTISLQPITSRRGVHYLVVIDDSPEGFLDLTESYKLYAKSKKRDDATKRGRMNVGEKRVLALCEQAKIISTTGTVEFKADGTRLATKGTTKTGTEFDAIIRLNVEQAKEALTLLESVLVPEHVSLMVNGMPIRHRPAERSLDGTLPTVLPDEEGKLTRKTRRKTAIRLVALRGTEKAHIYEMGIPVCETDTPWHIDVQQRVPLNTERDNVPPAYLRELREHVLNAAWDTLTQEEAHKPWVAEALPAASDAAVTKVITERFGEKIVIFDPSCPEANKRATEQGYAVIYGRQLPTETFSRVKDLGLARPSGQLQELRGDHQTSPDGEPPIPVKDYTAGMQQVTRYAHSLAVELLGKGIMTAVFRMPVGERWRASFGGGLLSFNLTNLGHKFFDSGNEHAVDELLIHEFAHDKVSDHLSNAFSDECCRLGAKLRNCNSRL